MAYGFDETIDETDLKNAVSKRIKNEVKSINHLRLLPQTHSTGTYDFIRSVFKSDYYEYYSQWIDIVHCSDLMLGGYMKYNHRTPLGDWRDDYDYCVFQSRMQSYDKYLCTDGRVRFFPSEESDALCRLLIENYEKESRERIRESFKSSGMMYIADEDRWIDPVTGEWACY